MIDLIHRRTSRGLVAGLAGALIAGTAVVPSAVAAQSPAEPGAAAAPTAASSDATADTGSRFTVAVLPDTQFYSRYSASQFFPKYGTDPFAVQTGWIVEHDEELNTAFTLHLGDVVDQQGQSAEWTAAGNAIQVLEDGGAPYSILPGNHDVANQGVRSSAGNATNYLRTFPQSRTSADATWVAGYQDGFSNAYRFEAEGQEFLVLAIGWNASADTWDWAQSVLDAHPALPTILTSHAIIDVDKATGEAADTGFGQEMWEELIRSNDQIFVTLNGHFHGQTRRVLTNDAGHDVHQLLLDSQMAADGGNGIMGMMEFDLDAGTLDFATISPWVTVKAEDSITPSDTPVLTGDQADFTLDIDFEERFAGFAPDFGPGDGEAVDLSERAKEIVSEGWEGGNGTGGLEPAGSREDYIEVDGTLAHWRFGDLEEGVFPEGGTVTDETGANPMHRLPLDQINAPAEVDDVTVTRENVSVLSADKGAMCFDEASRQTGRLNYITTDYEVPVTKAAFEDGYTVESFVYLSHEWTVEDNQWGGWLTRTGRRSTLPILWEQYDYEMGPAFFSVSNLREFQWGTSQGTPWAHTTSVWSGEIMQGNWYHVAVVNDPAKHTTVMYVDGVPVLRNANNHDGMTFNDGYPWAIGTNWNYDEANNGWNGCVGETRIVDHPLATSEFLINRADIDADGAHFAMDDAPEGELAAGTSVSMLSGDGFAGATVRVEDASGAELGHATVADDGTWTVELASPVTAAGTHEWTVTQSLGSRDGAPATVAFSIAAPAAIEFVDVADTHVFADQIAWLAAQGISRGWDTPAGAEFRPYANVNRDVMAAFLYRMAGSPEFEAPEASPFLDVPVTHVFYKEIAWLEASGVSEGWAVDGGAVFRPTRAVNRDVMAAFLHRFVGSPEFEAPEASPFLDVPESHVFYKEIAWLEASGVSEGWAVDGGAEFRPTSAVKRDVMAAFLARLDALGDAQQ